MLMAVMAICTGCAKNEETEVVVKKETVAVETTVKTISVATETSEVTTAETTTVTETVSETTVSLYEFNKNTEENRTYCEESFSCVFLDFHICILPFCI